MGHSMGGIVATSLLPNEKISAIITMSTPHLVPPARFDSRINEIYRNTKRVLDTDPTPILSLCGGATDLMIPSEACVLPPTSGIAFRRTVFTSGLDGAWTGVGHREMVWCHQVRTRVARAALELTAATSSSKRGHILDTWLRDGQRLPSNDSIPNSGSAIIDPSGYHVITDDERIVVARPQHASMHLAPVPSSSVLKAVVFVGLGSILPNPSPSSYPLRVSVLLCTKTAEAGGKCSSLEPSLLGVIPNPAVGKTFPLAEQGAEESDGVGVFEAEVPSVESEARVQRWLGIRIEGGEGRGWVYGGFSMDDEVTVSASTFCEFLRSLIIYIGWLIPTATTSTLIWQCRCHISGQEKPTNPFRISKCIIHRSSGLQIYPNPARGTDVVFR